jgi:hypothetical protein
MIFQVIFNNRLVFGRLEENYKISKNPISRKNVREQGRVGDGFKRGLHWKCMGSPLEV